MSAASTAWFLPRAASRSGPPPFAVVGAIILHAAIIAVVAFGAARSTEALPEYKVYRVDIFSPPPQQQGEAEALKPKPEVVRPTEPKQVAIERKPAPVKAPPKTKTASGTGTSSVAKGRNPDPKSLVGGEGIDVHIAGAEFPYPEYLENIILQLNRYFRWTGAANLEAKIGFDIMRDGSARNIRVLQKSGNINFDLETISAIENAGQRNAFGVLPKGWVEDRLRVSFNFAPPGR